MRRGKAAKRAAVRRKPAQVEPKVHAAAEAVRSRISDAFVLPPEERAGAIPDLIDALTSVPPPAAAELMAEMAQSRQEEAVPVLEALAEKPDPEYAPAAVEALGFIRSPLSAALLVSIERTPASKSLGKSARRAIHRLRSQGVPVEEEIRPAAPEVSAPGRRIVRSVLSSVDSRGDQILGLLVSAPLTGTVSVMALIEDTAGIKEMAAVPMRKREFDQELAAMADSPTVVDAPAPYVLSRMREAEALSREKGNPVPTDYHVYRDLFHMPGPEPERPPVYEEIDPEEVRSDPSLLKRSDELFEVREFSAWCIEPDRAKDYAAQLIQVEESPIILSDAAKEERTDRVFRTAAEETFTSETRALYKRRLEENAYVLLHTERADQARIALAIAIALSPDGPEAERIPFARELVKRSIATTVHEDRRERRIHIAR